MTDQPSLPFENSGPGLGSARRRPRSGAGDPIPNTSSDRGTRVGVEPDRADTPAGTESATARDASPFENVGGAPATNRAVHPDSADPRVEGTGREGSNPSPAQPFENRLGPSHHNAPETSGQAAVANYPREASQRQRILTALYSADLTDDEIANETRLVGNSVRPRRRRLVQDGLVEDSGKRTSSNFGHPAVVWTLTEEGLRVAKELADD